MWFHYECDGVKDGGFGCTYRSIQNAQKIMDVPIMSLEDIRSQCGVTFRTWLEPVDAIVCFPGDVNLSLVICGNPGQTRGSRDMYREVNMDELGSLIKSSYVSIVDNGTYTYAITDGGSTLLDPHTKRQDQVARPIPLLTRFLKHSSGWMVALFTRALVI